ncbi:hypothetical protein DFA_00221 [Cavenderia fasciculata]|uniref:SD-repeat containing protein B domain-containing protein n=1 Tax=Cavenderia fasciculata TaxID=261658 RepID=F4PXY3_CACFS|nr:uncharacterized protein DFA_00221 [Cavenderia fasciculata]EGG19643.1 hypothetical protein DFA_00221 [Cavenderia fasciculata]|eukprot:XP_004357937.1 hypothetical protein DFA_00221 [Cavenderia fasciculata]
MTIFDDNNDDDDWADVGLLEGHTYYITVPNPPSYLDWSPQGAVKTQQSIFDSNGKTPNFQLSGPYTIIATGECGSFKRQTQPIYGGLTCRYPLNATLNIKLIIDNNNDVALNVNKEARDVYGNLYSHQPTTSADYDIYQYYNHVPGWYQANITGRPEFYEFLPTITSSDNSSSVGFLTEPFKTTNFGTAPGSNPPSKPATQCSTNYVVGLTIRMYDASSRMSGRINTTNGDPMANINVTLIPDDPNYPTVTVLTDSNGMYSFDPVRPGVYTISVFEQDYQITKGYKPIATVSTTKQFRIDPLNDKDWIENWSNSTAPTRFVNNNFNFTIACQSIPDAVELYTVLFYDPYGNGTYSAANGSPSNLDINLYDTNSSAILQTQTTNSTGGVMWTGLIEGHSYYIKVPNPPSYLAWSPQGAANTQQSYFDASGKTPNFQLSGPYEPIKTTVCRNYKLATRPIYGGLKCPSQLNTTLIVTVYLDNNRDNLVQPDEGMLNANHSTSGLLVTLISEANSKEAMDSLGKTYNKTPTVDGNTKVYYYYNHVSGWYHLNMTGRPEYFEFSTPTKSNDDSNSTRFLTEPFRTDTFGTTPGSIPPAKPAYRCITNYAVGVGVRIFDASSRISGRINNTSGSPMPDATVTITPDNPAYPSITVQTDENGMYSFDSLRPGTYTISVVEEDHQLSSGYKPIASTTNTKQFKIDPANDKDWVEDWSNNTRFINNNFNFSLACQPIPDAIELNTIIFYDPNTNGAYNAANGGPSNIVVNLYDTNSTAILQTQTTNSTGGVTWTGLLEGHSYYMKVPNPPTWLKWSPQGSSSYFDATGTTPTFSLSGPYQAIKTATCRTYKRETDAIYGGLACPSPINATLSVLVFIDNDQDGSIDLEESISATLYSAATNLEAKDTFGKTYSKLPMDSDGKYFYYYNHVPAWYYVNMTGRPDFYGFVSAIHSNDDSGSIRFLTEPFKTDTFGTTSLARSNRPTKPADHCSANYIIGYTIRLYDASSRIAGRIQTYSAANGGPSNIVVNIYDTNSTAILQTQTTNSTGGVKWTGLLEGHTYYIKVPNPPSWLVWSPQSSTSYFDATGKTPNFKFSGPYKPISTVGCRSNKRLPDLINGGLRCPTQLNATLIVTVSIDNNRDNILQPEESMLKANHSTSELLITLISELNSKEAKDSFGNAYNKTPSTSSTTKVYYFYNHVGGWHHLNMTGRPEYFEFSTPIKSNDDSNSTRFLTEPFRTDNFGTNPGSIPPAKPADRCITNYAVGVNVRLYDASSRISGRITSPTGSPIPDAAVFILPDNPAYPLLSVETDANGAYSITPIRPGVYSITVAKEDYILTSGYKPIASTATTVQFRIDPLNDKDWVQNWSGNTRFINSNFNFNLTCRVVPDTVELYTVIFYDPNTNGAYSAANGGPSDIVVNLYDTNSSAILQTRTTNSTGGVMWSGLLEGHTYYVQVPNRPSWLVWSPQGAINTQQSSFDSAGKSPNFQLSGPYQTIGTVGCITTKRATRPVYGGLACPYPINATLIVLVFIDNDRDSVIDLEESMLRANHSVSGISATLYSAATNNEARDVYGNTYSKTPVDSDGKYFYYYNHVPAWYYVNMTGRPEFFEFVSAIHSNDDPSSYRFLSEPFKTDTFGTTPVSNRPTKPADRCSSNYVIGVAVRIFDSSSRITSRVADTNGNAIANAQIKLTPENTYYPTLSATTDANGQYTLSGIRPGIYSISVTASGWKHNNSGYKPIAAGSTSTGLFRISPATDKDWVENWSGNSRFINTQFNYVMTK